MDSNITFYSQGGGGLTKLPMQELELKLQGGLCAGGVFAGFYGIIIIKELTNILLADIIFMILTHSATSIFAV